MALKDNTAGLNEILTMVYALPPSGGEDSSAKDIATGTVTFAEETTARDVSVEHNLGTIPSGMAVLIIDTTAVSSSNKIDYSFPQISLIFENGKYVFVGNASSSASASMYGKIGFNSNTIEHLFSATETSIKLGNSTTIYYGEFPPATTVRWFVWR